MRYPNAPARPKFSKALALTTVSTMALVVSAATADNALAGCGTSGAPSGTIVFCQDGVGVNNLIINSTTASNGILIDDVSGNGVINNASITLTRTGATPDTIGINADDDGVFGSYTVVNNAAITLSSDSYGRLYGIAGNGDAASVSIENNSLISISRSSTNVRTLTSNLLTFGSSGNGSTLRVAAGLFSEEELESFNVINTGTISASGSFTSGIYSRAGEFELENEGTISNIGGIAIAAVSDSGIASTVNITNTNAITGDVLIVNGDALRWYGLSNYQGADPNNTLAGFAYDNRLNINSQFGEIDSTIENEGTITGKLYYGNGTHTLVNEEGATITGSIDVDQRMMVITPSTTTCWISGANPSTRGTCAPSIVASNNNKVIESVRTDEPSENQVIELTAFQAFSGNLDGGTGTGASYIDKHYIWGAKDFYFENSGTFVGAVTVTTQDETDVVIAGATYTSPDSKVTIAPHIFGGGTTDKSFNADAQAYIDGTLTVKDGIINGNVNTGTSSLARTTEIAPVIDSLVRSGEWYTIATNLNDTQAEAQATEVEGSGLVTWEADKVGNRFMIGSTVADASSISGLSAPGVAALNGLMNLDTEDEDALEFAGAIQNLSAADVKTAGEQLAPDTSRATTNATNQLASLYSNAIGQRLTGGLNGTGTTGGSGFAPPSGLGMGTGEAKPLAKPMYLQGSGDDAPASQGREAAWAQAFGANLNQDAISSTGAYDADLYGFMGGYDGSISQNFRAGVAFGYGNTSISETGVRQGNATEIESYNATAYAAARGANWYLTGQLGYTSHDFMTQRRFSAGGNTANANGTHDGDQFTAAGELGSPIRMAGAIVTPVASLAYNKLDQDAYTERGTAGFALAVGSQSSTSLVSGLGVRTSLALAAGTALEARAIWLHEFDDTNQAVTASFASASNAFTSTGASLSADSANLGVGLNMNSGTGYALQLNYYAYVSDDFLAHAGTGRVRVEF